VFLLDDLILKELGIEIPGLSLIWTIQQLINVAYRELYDPEKIKASIKENRMLYEFGERSKEEYEREHERLASELKMAMMGEDVGLVGRSDILGALSV
jgi:hypothetical protein